jgi:ubiquinone/menaquinone biosynthesis C-methylase UbiE
MAEINLLDKYPQSKRPVDERGEIISEELKEVARQYGKDYFDGDRIYGYGGYNYHPRFWTDTVKRFRDHYGLGDEVRILDVGCAKGFMMHDFQLLMPGAEIQGIDISDYALAHAKDEMRPNIRIADCRDIPWEDNYFDLVICINTVHNLPNEGCKRALSEIERVSGGGSFITVDAWRNEEEKDRLLRWMLTAYTYMHVDDWKEYFAEAGYTGDYSWFIP